MILSIAVLAISLSIDALGVGIVYGIREIKIPVISKIVICFFSVLYSGAALIIGKSMSSFLPQAISRYIGVSILFVMGTWIILQALLKKDPSVLPEKTSASGNKTLLKIAIKSLGVTIHIIKNPVEGDIDKSGTIDLTESLLLGLALSVDAIGVGIGSALAGFHSLGIPFAIGMVQLTFLYAGTYMGRKFSLSRRLNKKLLSAFPGILLIILALIRIY